MTVRRWRRGRAVGRAGIAVTVVAATAAATAGAAVPAGATAPPVTQPAQAAERPGDRTTADQEFLAAIQRDLELSAEETVILLSRQAEAIELAEELTETLGDEYAGAWIDPDDGELVVAVTAPTAARQVRAAGADPTLVAHSMDDLTAITDELNELVDTDASSLAGVTSWAIDPANNQVVVTAQADAEPVDLLAGYGDAVRVEETDHPPMLAVAYLDGGVRYYDNLGGWCSTGFNVEIDGVGHFLTVGHCGPAGRLVSRNGRWIGPVVESWFPEYDDALVRNDRPEYWIQGPWVANHLSVSPPSFYTLRGHRLFSLPGTAVCKSGATTGLTCGEVTGINESVVFEEGAVHGLTRFDACVEPGDSGGATFSWGDDGRYYADGMANAGRLRLDIEDTWNYRCLSHYGEENVSWFMPIFPVLHYYGATLMTNP